MPYKDAWLLAVEEYNSYGIASQDPKYRIDKSQAGLMLGFKARLTLKTFGKKLR